MVCRQRDEIIAGIVETAFIKKNKVGQSWLVWVGFANRQFRDPAVFLYSFTNHESELSIYIPRKTRCSGVNNKFVYWYYSAYYTGID
jgi:hypothetical protein